ncbi:XRE family transcriptional regulator [Sphingomonas sp. VNH70]|uniref:XRE family transcriptional regulator n=1 Tax=Sphingomonas silueang TaxID=3156617 RepID=UPI0032B41EE3
MILTPGAYLKLRRTAAGLAVEDVAQAIATVPGIPEGERVAWLRLIEADEVPMLWSTIVALHRVFAFDLAILEHFSLPAQGYAVAPPTLCVVCAEGHPACLALGAAMAPGPITLCLECASAAKADGA